MDLVLVLVFVLVFLVSFLFLSRQKSLPPGPISLPVIGCVQILKKLASKEPYIVFDEAAKKYGKVMSFKIGQERFVILHGYDVIYQALVKQADAFSNRPSHLPQIKSLTKDGGGVLFQQHNHQWKMMRRFTLQTLRDFGVGKTSIEEKILLEITAASKVLSETNGQPFVIAPLLQNIVGNIIYGIIFGQRYDYDDPDFGMVRAFTNDFVEGDGPLSPINLFPSWMAKLLTAIVKPKKGDLERDKVAEKITNFLLEKIKEHEDTFDDNSIRDFVDLYIQVSRDHKEDTRDIFTEGNMLRVIQDLFLAGSETTSTTLDWAILYMIEYPDIQKKCQQEIETVVGDKPIVYADRGKLPYIDATIMEVQRLGNILPLGVMHATSRDTELLGYTIPKGSLVVPLLYSVFYDPTYWTDPHMFNPDRFINKDGKIIRKDAFIPFSTGPRICLGESLAKMELFVVLANLLQKFTFEREDKHIKHPLTTKPNQVTNAPFPYKIRVKKRDKHR